MSQSAGKKQAEIVWDGNFLGVMEFACGKTRRAFTGSAKVDPGKPRARFADLFRRHLAQNGPANVERRQPGTLSPAFARVLLADGHAAVEVFVEAADRWVAFASGQRQPFRIDDVNAAAAVFDQSLAL